MAPLQLRLEPTEVVSTTDSGAARVRVDSTDESSLQSSGSWGECSKDPFGSPCTPHYYHSKKLSTTTPFGVLQISSESSTHSLNLINYLPTAYTSSLLTTTFTVSQMEVRAIDAQPLKTKDRRVHVIAPRSLYAMPRTE
eukprot:scaffold10708_cov117-Isochrysis_galbana.AAC.1